MEYEDLRNICLTQRAIRAAVHPDVYTALICGQIGGMEDAAVTIGMGMMGAGPSLQGFIRLRWVAAGRDPYLGEPTQAPYTDIYKHPRLLPSQVGIMARQPE